MVSGSWACTSIGNPKSVGRFPLTSRQDSPASSLRMTSQCFCMNSTSGRDGCIARRCTQCPTSASGSGMPSDCRPWLIGRQVWPASSERNAPAAEIAANIRPGCARVQQDRVQAHPARARLPGRAGLVAAQPGQLLPALPAVGRAEQPGVLHPGVDRVRVVQRRLQVPDPLELPRVRRPVVPLVGAGGAVVGELVAHRRPGRAAVVGALDHLPGPAAGLRGVQPVRVGRRALHVVDLPAREMRPADLPLLPLAVRGQDERALARARQYPYTAHPCSLQPRPARRRARPGRHDHA